MATFYAGCGAGAIEMTGMAPLSRTSGHGATSDKTEGFATLIRSYLERGEDVARTVTATLAAKQGP